jgi:AhpD family alkylhydroperoxidase
MDTPRIQLTFEAFTHAAPTITDTLRRLGALVAERGLDKPLTELVKLRASQLNGCAFCLQFHLGIARRLGLPAEKLDLLCVWRETDLFSARERAALAWTETLTLLHHDDSRSAAESALAAHFTPDEILSLTVAIGTINQWNRIAVGLRFPPQFPQHSAPGAG